jgi:hypothetical protein
MPEGIHYRCLGGPDRVVGIVVAIAPAIKDAENNGSDRTSLGAGIWRT